MLEVIIPVALAAIGGLGAMTNRMHSRITYLDRRIDEFELRIAENYVRREDLTEMIERVESHLIRLENKLDKLTFR